jgi:hypothetical protein
MLMSSWQPVDAATGHASPDVSETTLQGLSNDPTVAAIRDVLIIWLHAKHGMCCKLQLAITLRPQLQIQI